MIKLFKLLSFYLQLYLPPWFYNFLNFASSFWAKIIAALAFILLIRTVTVFFKSRRKWGKKYQISLEELKNLAQSKNLELPFFSILVPARNEAEVVEKTLRELGALNYPQNKYEIIIITDEKETLSKHKDKQHISQDNADIGLTTQEVVQKVIADLKQTSPELTISHQDVPYDFSGEFGGKCISKEVKSTKGRALNFALTKLKADFDAKTKFFAFFDTDDHPDKNCLLAIAKENLQDPKKKVFQLPVYQCRNFWQISSFTKVVALSQAFTHENFLPWIMTWLPFLGGTNLFIEKNVLFQAGGFNHQSITEDLDLGINIYLKTNNWPSFLPLPSTEQTPPTIKTYFRQRKRWALGQLEVIQNLKKLLKQNPPNKELIKTLYYRLLLYGPIESFFFFILTVFSFIILCSRLLRGIILVINLQSFAWYFPQSYTFSEIVYTLASTIGLPMVLFSLILLLRYNKYIEEPRSQWFAAKELTKFILVEGLFIPFVLFLYPLPFVIAFVEYNLGLTKHQETVWVKTPRTKE